MINVEVLDAYFTRKETWTVQVLSSGLINTTWKIHSSAGSFIVQRINTHVFKNPQAIAQNIDRLATYLRQFPDYFFVAPIHNRSGNSYTDTPDGHYRIFPFVENSYTVDSVSSSKQAFEAAAQFGKFSAMLTDFDVTSLNITIPDFHNISLRYQQFLEATESGNPKRIKESTALINDLKSHIDIVDQFEQLKKDRNFIPRVTHHDTKISNILYDGSDNGLCVIDLDTVMPGYFISDVGDMIRTYISPVTEEETDFSKIIIRTEIFEAIVSGYLQHMRSLLTEPEKKSMVYAGKFLVYMQALRFATDYLNNDVYYGKKYDKHNLNRATNQLVLLQKLVEKEAVLNAICGRLIH